MARKRKRRHHRARARHARHPSYFGSSSYRDRDRDPAPRKRRKRKKHASHARTRHRGYHGYFRDAGRDQERDWSGAPISHARSSVLGWQRRFKRRHKKGPMNKGKFGGQRRPVLFHPRSKTKTYGGRDAGRQRDWTGAPISHARSSVLGWQRRFKRTRKKGPKDPGIFDGQRHPVLFHPRSKTKTYGKRDASYAAQDPSPRRRKKRRHHRRHRRDHDGYTYVSAKKSGGSRHRALVF